MPMELRPRLLLIITLIVVLALYGCTKSLGQGTSVADQLEIRYEAGLSIRAGDDLEFWVKNGSNLCISFPADYGLKLFVKAGQTWVQVPNLDKYVGEGPILLKPTGDVFSENIVGFTPDVSDLNLTTATDSYASIAGHLCDDKSVVVEKEIPFTATPQRLVSPLPCLSSIVDEQRLTGDEGSGGPAPYSESYGYNTTSGNPSLPIPPDGGLPCGMLTCTAPNAVRCKCRNRQDLRRDCRSPHLRCGAGVWRAQSTSLRSAQGRPHYQGEQGQRAVG